MAANPRLRIRSRKSSSSVLNPCPPSRHRHARRSPVHARYRHARRGCLLCHPVHLPTGAPWDMARVTVSTTALATFAGSAIHPENSGSQIMVAASTQ